MKPLILALPLLIACVVTAQESRIVQQYDRFENRTRYWTRPVLVDQGLDLSAHLTFKGQGAGHEVDGLYLIFTSKNSDWQYLKNSRLFVLVDGERLDLGTARFQDNDVKTSYTSVEVKEWLAFPVKYATVLKISRARQAEARLGRNEFQLPREFVDSLEELLNKFRVVKAVREIR